MLQRDFRDIHWNIGLQLIFASNMADSHATWGYILGVK